jgi:hypothetical protein
MDGRNLIILLLAIGIVRFALLAWSGYRTGTVKSAALWSPRYDRRKQPRVWRGYMALHIITAALLAAGALALGLGLLPISS